MKRLSGFTSDQEGSAFLEGAVLVPVLFALVFGVVEFSYYFYQHHLVSTGVRDAARYLARVQNPTAAAAQTTAQNLAATGSPAGGSTRRTPGFDPSEVSISFSFADNTAVGGVRPYRPSSDPTIPDQLRIVNVTGSFTWAPLAFWDFFGFGTKNVTVTHSERWIGQS